MNLSSVSRTVFKKFSFRYLIYLSIYSPPNGFDPVKPLKKHAFSSTETKLRLVRFLTITHDCNLVHILNLGHEDLNAYEKSWGN